MGVPTSASQSDLNTPLVIGPLSLTDPIGGGFMDPITRAIFDSHRTARARSTGKLGNSKGDHAGYTAQVQAQAESFTNISGHTATAQASVSISDEIEVRGFPGLWALWRDTPVTIGFDLSGEFTDIFFQHNVTVVGGRPSDIANGSVSFTFSSQSLIGAIGPNGPLQIFGAAHEAKSVRVSGSNDALPVGHYEFTMLPTFFLGGGAEDEPAFGGQYAYSLSIAASAEARGAIANTDFGNSLTFESIHFANGSTPESLGFQISSSLGYASPNGALEPSPSAVPEATSFFIWGVLGFTAIVGALRRGDHR